MTTTQAQKKDYEILIPSRKRVHNAKNILELLPTAKLFVDEREAADYAEVVGDDVIITHKPTNGIVEVRTLAIQQAKARGLFMVDDDLKSVISIVGRRSRKITKPASILRIIDNGFRVADDLGIKLFGWNRNPNPMQFFSTDPFGWVGPVAGIIGVIGKRYIPDKRLTNYEDVDMTMQCLLNDRVVMCDRRYYFDFGRVWKGVGGLQGVRTSNSEEMDRAFINRKWGIYANVGMSTNASRKKTSASTGMQIKVLRKSQLASTR